jgi:tRNA A37 N6-isopentenylltransferase MiaA
MDDSLSPNQSPSLSRRLFGKNVLATTAATLLPTAPVAKTSTVPASEQHLGLKPEELSAADWDDVHAKYLNLLRVYGKRLSSEDRRRLIRILTTNQQMLVSIRSFEVQNGDPSACTLRLRV